VGPARMFAESLTPSPGIREQSGGERTPSWPATAAVERPNGDPRHYKATMLQYRVRPSHVLGASLIGGTCCVASSDGKGARPIDDRTIAFGEIRSPGTIRNLRANPRIEVNFVDVFVRKGFRFAGTATVPERGQADFEILLPKLCSALAHRIRAIDRSDQGAAFNVASV